MTQLPPEENGPRFLDYRSPAQRKPRMNGGQIAAGIAVWIAAVVLGCWVGAGLNSPWGGFFVFAAVLAPASVYFTSRLGWRGFLPGVLIGMALTCLVPLGIVAVMCGINR